MQPKDIALIAMYVGALGGYAVGKLDLDVKVMEAVKRQQIRVATQNANILVDTLEKRKLGIPVASS